VKECHNPKAKKRKELSVFTEILLGVSE